MVFGAFIALVPNWVFVVVHLVALGTGVALAVRKKGKPIAVLFGLYALAELSYLLYHIPVFNILFSHVVAEVLLLAGVLYVGLR